MHGKDSPLYYRFDSTFKVVNDGSAFYPIELHYTGMMPDDKHEHIRKVYDKKTVRYSPADNQYQ